MATLSDLLIELQFHTGRPDLTAVGGQGNKALNRATLELTLQVKPMEMRGTQIVTTASGVPSYTLDTNCIAILNVRNDSANLHLQRGSQREFDHRNQATLGRPQRWFRFVHNPAGGDVPAIFLYDNVPDSNNGTNYTVLVRKLIRPALMSAGANTFPLSLEWEDPVVLLAAWQILERVGDPLWQQKRDAYQAKVASVLDIFSSIENAADRDAGVQPLVRDRTAR